MMLEALQEDGDLHSKTAQLLLCKATVTKENRQLAKGVNFGLTYGMSSWGKNADRTAVQISTLRYKKTNLNGLSQILL